MSAVACDDDRATRGTNDAARDAAPELVPAGTDDDEASIAIGCKLRNPAARRTLEDLTFGSYARSGGERKRTVEDAPRVCHLGGQPALVHGEPRKPAGPRRT
jgi:hypothetical protein